MPRMQEFSSQLSMANVGGRPLTVTLARFQEHNKPLIGCSKGFLKLAGRPRNDVIGVNCRFLNQGLDMAFSTRERLHYTIRTGVPFMGILKNKRYVDDGSWEIFDNLLYTVVVFVGVRSYIVGVQVNVTGLDVDLADGSQDAAGLQLMFDSVLSSGVDSWILWQERRFQLAPLYLHPPPAGDSNDQVEIMKGQCQASDSAVQQIPDQYLVSPQQVSPLKWLQDKSSRRGDQSLNYEACAHAAYSLTQCPLPSMSFFERELQYEDAATVSGKETKSAGITVSPSLTVSWNHSLSKAHKSVISTGAAHDESSCIPLPETQIKQPSTEFAKMEIGSPTMKNQLRALGLEDPHAVIIARGISKLGLSADEILCQYFTNFGSVKAVYIPHTFKKKAWKRNIREPRAPGRCFIVMCTPEERTKILAEATRYLIQGVEVTLEAFSAKPCQ